MEPDLLEYIRQYKEQHGYPPTIRECGAYLGRGASATHQRLRKLERDGLIRTTPGIPRSITITESVMKAPEETM